MGKHFSGNYTKKSKSKLIIVLVILAIITIGVGTYVYYINIQKKAPEIAINNTMQALKNYDIEKINSYLEYNQLLSSLDEMLINENIDTKTVEKKLFESLEWNVENIEIDGEKATAVVEVNNKDFIEVVTDWMKKIVNERNKGTEVTDGVSLKKLEETLEETETMENVIKKISLEKIENTWKIKIDGEFTNLVFPGLDSVINVLNKT